MELLLDLRAFNKHTIHILFLLILILFLGSIVAAVIIIFYIKPGWLPFEVFTDTRNMSYNLRGSQSFLNAYWVHGISLIFLNMRILEL